MNKNKLLQNRHVEVRGRHGNNSEEWKKSKNILGTLELVMENNLHMKINAKMMKVDADRTAIVITTLLTSIVSDQSASRETYRQQDTRFPVYRRREISNERKYLYYHQTVLFLCVCYTSMCNIASIHFLFFVCYTFYNFFSVFFR